jgi:uncharacterized membrane protein
MIHKVTSALTVLRRGQMVANPATWKNRQIAVTSVSALVAAVFALAEVFGYGVPLDKESLDGIAAGIVAIVLLFNGWATVATTEKVGLSPVEREAEPEPVVRVERSEYEHPDTNN